MSVAIIIVNFRTAPLIAKCLESLAAERRHVRDMQVTVVDGDSGDGSAESLRALLAQEQYRDWTSLVALDINGGFGFANNASLSKLLSDEPAPEFIMLLNPDTEVEAGAVQILQQYLRDHPRVGAVGSQLLEPDGTPTGSVFPFPSLRGELARGAGTGIVYRLLRAPPVALSAVDRDIEADWVTGASVMLRAEALRESGLFDDGFFLYHEETELMWRMRKAGWKICHEPRSRVRHVGGAATGVHSRPAQSVTRPRRPAYWYSSRRRFFALTRGRPAASMATLCWAAGYLIAALRRTFRLGGNTQPTANEFFDQLHHGFAWRREVRSSSTRWDSPRMSTPAWMNRRD
jgi:GT2 family glycosyltransferase